jgi:predicted RecA/RadA family phage recombinase
MATAARPYAAKVGGNPIMVPYTKASGSVIAGDVIVTGGIPAVAIVDIPAFTGGETLDAVSTFGGIYACMADGAIGVGVQVYWDATNKKVTLTAAGNTIFGFTVAGPTGGFEGTGTNADGDTAYVFHDPASILYSSSLQVRATTALAKTTNVTLADITGLSVTLAAGGKYAFKGTLFTSSTANGGAKVGFGGTATATSLIAEGALWNGATIGTVAQVTALGTLVNATEATTKIEITGEIVVNAGGTLTIQGAQNASHADTTTFKVGSFLVVYPLAA